jgi:hypothetical protein
MRGKSGKNGNSWILSAKPVQADEMVWVRAQGRAASVEAGGLLGCLDSNLLSLFVACIFREPNCVLTAY